MTSHYDLKKKCRVGTMDENQFYAEANEKTARYFKSLIAGWKKKGGKCKWGAGDVGLRAEVAGKEVGICFLAPTYAGKKDRIELSLNSLAKQIGTPLCEELKSSMQEAAGDCF